MPTPFPGMDPYLEDPVYWPDLHHSFATYVRDELQSLVRPNYDARVEERVYIGQTPEFIIPDASVRSGTHAAAVPLDALPYPRDWDYLVSVSPTGWRRQFEVYRRTIRERLPRISVPLSDPDPDVVLDLQSVLNRCYDNGAYGATIDYALDPLTSIKESDREWARDLPAASKIEENTELNRAGLPKEKA